MCSSVKVYGYGDICSVERSECRSVVDRQNGMKRNVSSVSMVCDGV